MGRFDTDSPLFHHSRLAQIVQSDVKQRISGGISILGKRRYKAVKRTGVFLDASSQGTGDLPDIRVRALIAHRAQQQRRRIDEHADRVFGFGRSGIDRDADHDLFGVFILCRNCRQRAEQQCEHRDGVLLRLCAQRGHHIAFKDEFAVAIRQWMNVRPR